MPYIAHSMALSRSGRGESLLTNACLKKEHSRTDEFVWELAEMHYRRGLRNRISATAEQELAGRKNYVNRHVSRESKIFTPALS
jgi:hypothetical protein